MTVTHDVTSPEMLWRQVQSLQRLLADAELRAEWHLRRVHDLEAFIGDATPIPGSNERDAEPRAADDRPDSRGEQSRQDVRRLERALKARDAELRQKEIVVADLAAAVADAQRLVERATAEAASVREAAEQLSVQLREKEQENLLLTAVALERLHLVVAAETEAQQVRAECASLVDQLDSKEREIVNLRTVADERSRLLDEQAQAIEEKEGVIGELVAVAEDRLRLIERLDADARQLRDDLERLTSNGQAGHHVTELSSSS